ncbi:MAG: hypothetical protein IIB19_08120, partial [Chloroflexi bacterium]|nr:hypothetical protein [Chloroflexota bacterium]
MIQGKLNIPSPLADPALLAIYKILEDANNGNPPRPDHGDLSKITIEARETAAIVLDREADMHRAALENPTIDQLTKN